jgi:hypothetical protein
MPNFICVTCGTQYPESETPPAHCQICEDERQYVNPNGQTWTTLDELRKEHHNVIEEVEPCLHRLKSEPRVGIGQYAFLVQTPNGNVLWDCITLIDQATIEAVRKLGGIAGIAVSHPHFHSSIVEWSRAFGDAPVYIHDDNRQYVMRPDPAIVFWEGETRPLMDGITLVRGGGHFDGSAVLHWRDGADKRGVLLTADTIDIVADPRYVTFMYSYPNLIPLPANKVRNIVRAVQPFEFVRMYEAFGGVIKEDAKARVAVSAERYIRAIAGQ